jgi:hypothetical protein
MKAARNKPFLLLFCYRSICEMQRQNISVIMLSMWLRISMINFLEMKLSRGSFSKVISSDISAMPTNFTKVWSKSIRKISKSFGGRRRAKLDSFMKYEKMIVFEVNDDKQRGIK